MQILTPLVLALAALSAPAYAVSVAPPTSTSPKLCLDAVSYVAKSFAPVLVPATQPDRCLTGDFNGDGKADVILVTKVLADKLPATSNVKTLHTFGAENTGKGRLQFLALHSTSTSAAGEWAAYDKLLLDGDSPVLVLKHPDVENDLQRVSPRSKEVRELQAPSRKMKGDAVYLTTEAVSAILYWNGKSYVFHEDPAGP